MHTIPHILIVEDNKKLAAVIASIVTHEKYRPHIVCSVEEAKKYLDEKHVDLVILDRMLPNEDGLELLEKISRHPHPPKVIILSVKSAGADKVLGLKKGADDYLAKPFEVEELLLRIQKLLDKDKHTKNFTFDGNQIDFQSGIAINFKQKSKQLSPKQLHLLSFLIDNKNTFLKREKLLSTVWGEDISHTTRTLDNHIAHLRKFFERSPHYPKHLLSKRHIGYMFKL